MFSKRLQIIVIGAFLLWVMLHTLYAYAHVDLIGTEGIEQEVERRIEESSKWDGPTAENGDPLN